MASTLSLIELVRSMTKTEKKAFSTLSKRTGAKDPNYVKLYNMIANNRQINSEALRKMYVRQHGEASFNTTTKHLYQTLLDVMVHLRSDQDSYFSLFDMMLKARILFEKSLFEDCFDTLHKAMDEARKAENYYALLIASRMELEYLLFLHFPHIDESTLLNKQFRLNEVLRTIQKINQQSALYELLKHRVLYKGHTRSEKQKNDLNDLVVSEMSIVASSNIENFEIKKLHQLFQANYLISVGDYKSALHSYYELHRLLEDNKKLWANAPAFYVLTLEGILDSLRSLKNYEGMRYFIDQLKKIESPSIAFNANVNSLVFLYELFPLIDRGDFKATQPLIKKYDSILFKKLHLLSVSRYAEISLYTSLAYLGLREHSLAKKTLSKIIFVGKNFSKLPLYRTIRLANLMILYEKKEFDLIRSEARSIKRDVSSTGKEYGIEKNVLAFVNKQGLPVSAAKRAALWKKYHDDFERMRQSVFEQQILRLFDFSAWIEGKIMKKPLGEILSRRHAVSD